MVPLVLAAVGLAVALGLTAATGGPGSDAAEELAVIAAERDQAVAEARASLEEFASAQERRLDEFRAGTTIRSEIDRMQRQVTASVRQAERQFEERSEVAEEAYRARAEMLEASVSTQVMVGYAWRGLVGFILGGLAGLFFARARRDD